MSTESLVDIGPYVAVRFPESHVVFHMLIDEASPDDAYRELSERVLASVRGALAAMSVHVIETGEEATGG
jgi:hypothetical protein